MPVMSKNPTPIYQITITMSNVILKYDNAILGDVFKKCRKMLGLTQKDIGKYLQISPQQVQKYEAGQNVFSFEVFIRFLYIIKAECHISINH